MVEKRLKLPFSPQTFETLEGKFPDPSIRQARPPLCSGRWESGQHLNVSLKLSFFNSSHSFSVCANECNTTNALGERLSKTMPYYHMIHHVSSFSVMAFVLRAVAIRNICPSRCIQRHVLKFFFYVFLSSQANTALIYSHLNSFIHSLIYLQSAP